MKKAGQKAMRITDIVETQDGRRRKERSRCPDSQ
jgi:hypothetical protein